MMDEFELPEDVMAQIDAIMVADPVKTVVETVEEDDCDACKL
jgi:hypothetical protein